MTRGLPPQRRPIEDGKAGDDKPNGGDDKRQNQRECGFDQSSPAPGSSTRPGNGRQAGDLLDYWQDSEYGDHTDSLNKKEVPNGSRKWREEARVQVHQLLPH